MKKFFQSIYRKIPFKNELFSVLKKVCPLPGSIYQHLYFNGIIKVKVNNVQNFKMMHYGHPIENDLFGKAFTVVGKNNL